MLHCSPSVQQSPDILSVLFENKMARRESIKDGNKVADFRKQEQTTFHAEVTRILSTERFSPMAIRGAVSWSISTFVECRQTLMQYSAREYLSFFFFYERKSFDLSRKKKEEESRRPFDCWNLCKNILTFFILFGG